MNNIQCCLEAEDSLKLIRRRSQSNIDNEGHFIPAYDIKEPFTGNKKGWFYLDTFTARHILALYGAVSCESKKKMLRLDIVKLAEITFNLIK